MICAYLSSISYMWILIGKLAQEKRYSQKSVATEVTKHMLMYAHHWKLYEWGEIYGDISVISISSWSEMIFFYQRIYSEIMTSLEPISSYCQEHLAPVSTLWNHQIRSRELICDMHSKEQQHLSSLRSSLTAAFSKQQSFLIAGLFTKWVTLMSYVFLLYLFQTYSFQST